MKVVYLSPTYFDRASIMSGGERYVWELASEVAKRVDTTLVSFSPQRRSYQAGALKVEIYPVTHFIRGCILNPLSIRYLQAIRDADVVHVHQVNTLISDLACLMARAFGKRAFVTDHGGGGDLVLNRKLPVFPGYRHAIAQSQFCAQSLLPELQAKAVLIKGGIDIERFRPDPTLTRTPTILFVGRILPHKGVNYLIEALRLLPRSDYRLRIIGRAYDSTFYQDLKTLAEGLPVEFVHDADDQRLLREYQTATVTVLPSVHTDCYGNYTAVPELMGFTLLESQACGTPVICTDAGAMSEFVLPGKTGWVVAQNSAEAIAQALEQSLAADEQARTDYAHHCRDWVTQLSWAEVARQHLEIYQAQA